MMVAMCHWFDFNILFLLLRSKVPLGKVMLDRVSIVRLPRGRQGVVWPHSQAMWNVAWERDYSGM